MENLDYGVIGNGTSAALISKTGSIDFLCLPDFSSGSLFAKLLDDQKGGSFSLKTKNLFFRLRGKLPIYKISQEGFKKSFYKKSTSPFFVTYKKKDNLSSTIDVNPDEYIYEKSLEVLIK